MSSKDDLNGTDGPRTKDWYGVSRRDFIKSSTLGVAAMAAGPWIGALARAEEDTIRIGFPVPLTGPYGSEAKEQAACAQIAIDEFNAAGGLNGRMAKLLVRDDKLKPGEAAKRTLELIEKDNVHFICGSLSASVQLAVNSVATERGIIYNSISQSDTINEASDFTKYTFHEAMNPHMTAGTAGDYAFSRNRGKKVAYLVADYAYGHEMMRGFKVAGEQYGMETVAEVIHPLAAQDFSTFLPRIMAAGPDFLCLCNFGLDQLNSIKQAYSFGLKEKMQLVAPALLYNQRLAGGANIFEGVVGAANYHWTLEDSVPAAKAFNDKYRERHDGAPPSDYGAYGYAGVGTLLQAAKDAGTTRSDPVVEAMEALKYNLYKGPEYFRQCDHQAVQSVLVVESKPASAMRNEYDVFEVKEVREANESMLRSCEALGHKA